MSTVSDLLHGAIDKLEMALLSNEIGTAVVYFDRGDEKPYTMTDGQYWANENTIAAFEERAARHARELGSTRFAFAVDAIVAETEEAVYMRPPNLSMPMADFEREIMYVMACDLEVGIEVGRVEVTREGGSLSTGELLLLQGAAQFLDGAPGYAIVKAVAA